MTDTPEVGPEPVEGTAGEKAKIEYRKGSRVPLVILLIWMVFFVWMIAYLGTYMVPDLQSYFK